MNNEINKQKINASALYKLITKEMVYEVKEQLLASRNKLNDSNYVVIVRCQNKWDTSF